MLMETLMESYQVAAAWLNWHSWACLE